MGRHRVCQCEPPRDAIDAELAKPEESARKVRKDPAGVWRWKHCGQCGSLRKKRWRETKQRAQSERDEYANKVLANMMRDDDEDEDEENAGGDGMNNTQLVAIARALKQKLNVVVREIAVSDAGGAAAAFAMLQGLEKDLETRRARALGSVAM